MNRSAGSSRWGEPPTHADEHPSIPWAKVLSAANVWLMGGIGTCCAATTYLFFSWYSTYLQNGRSLSPEFSSRLAAVVLFSGAVGSFIGGHLNAVLSVTHDA